MRGRDTRPVVVTVSARRLPHHVGIILDGNGRWAERRGLPRTEGHRRGSDAVRRVVRAARRLGIGALTLYSFSAQNWSRPREEVDILMELLREYLLSERAEILDNGIRLVGVGDLDRLPPRVRDVLGELEATSSGNTTSPSTRRRTRRSSRATRSPSRSRTARSLPWPR